MNILMSVRTTGYSSYEVIVTTILWASLPLGASVGLFQWVMLRQFKVNLLVWASLTALGISTAMVLFLGGSSLNQYGLHILPQGKIDLSPFMGEAMSKTLGRIDVGRDLSSLLAGLGVLLGGTLTGGLQAIPIGRGIQKPWLWARANILGFLLPAALIPFIFFFRAIGAGILFLIGGFDLYVTIRDLFEPFLLLVTALSVAIHTGRVLTKISFAETATQSAGSAANAGPS